MTSSRFETPFFVGLLLFSVALALFILYPCLDAVVLAVTLAILFRPIHGKLRNLMPGWEGLAALITVILAVAIILAPLTFFGFRIFKEAQGLYTSFASGGKGPFLEFIHDKLAKLAPGFNLDLTQYAQQILAALVGSLGSILSKIVSVFGTFFLAIFALYYFLKDGTRLEDTITRTSPLSKKNTTEIISKLHIMANSVIKGTLAVAVVQGVFVGLGFLIFGLPSPVLWGSVSIVAALIPIIGTAIVVVPGIISLALSGDLVAAIGFMAWGILAVGLIDNFLRPRLIERKAKVHPLLVLLSVIGGLALFGPTGFLLGPLALSLFLTLLEIYPILILARTR